MQTNYHNRIKRMPLLMYPNGSFARSDTISEGCIVVEEPEIIEPPLMEDQTAAVKEAEYGRSKDK